MQIFLKDEFSISKKLVTRLAGNKEFQQFKSKVLGNVLMENIFHDHGKIKFLFDCFLQSQKKPRGTER